MSVFGCLKVTPWPPTSLWSIKAVQLVDSTKTLKVDFFPLEYKFFFYFSTINASFPPGVEPHWNEFGSASCSVGHWAWILIPVPSTWSHFYFSENIVSKLGSVLVFLDSFSICSLQLLDNSRPTLFWKKWPCWSGTQHRTWESLPPLRAHRSLAIHTTFHSSLLDGFALVAVPPKWDKRTQELVGAEPDKQQGQKRERRMVLGGWQTLFWFPASVFVICFSSFCDVWTCFFSSNSELLSKALRAAAHERLRKARLAI